MSPVRYRPDVDDGDVDLGGDEAGLGGDVVGDALPNAFGDLPQGARPPAPPRTRLRMLAG